MISSFMTSSCLVQFSVFKLTSVMTPKVSNYYTELIARLVQLAQTFTGVQIWPLITVNSERSIDLTVDKDLCVCSMNLV